MLTVNRVSVRYGDFAAVNDLSFRLEEGQWLMLAGPNGAGKSTLIEAIAQGVPYTGGIQWEGTDIRSLKPAQLARRVGVLSQKNTVGYAYTVEEVVGLGRYAYKSGFFSGRASSCFCRLARIPSCCFWSATAFSYAFSSLVYLAAAFCFSSSPFHAASYSSLFFCGGVSRLASAVILAPSAVSSRFREVRVL